MERGLSYCYCFIINREAGPQKYIQKLASNCSENSEVGFLLCCVADLRVSRQLEKLNSHYRPGPYRTSKGQIFSLGSRLWGWKQGCEALNVTLPSCV